ncbi:MAG: endonuclease/exonuclease/phosphatase family protein [Melioribacteraceae bacterium]|nr:endonuclease/exonuclease/phosphatase family protein [Melioribacteraceae bacterium]
MLKKIFLFLVISLSVCFSQDTVYVASYNLENLFDNIDDPDKKDEEFLAEGKKQWTDARIEQKFANLAKVINYMNNGVGPDILGVVEVEHEHLLLSLIEKHLKSKNYKTAYAEAPDNRGIDCGLIFNADLFGLEKTAAHEVILLDEYPTRSVLEVVLRTKADKNIHVFVNHWPSRRGGAEKSEPNRVAAAKVLKKSIQSINNSETNASIIVLGDFNDEPDNNSIKEILADKEYSKSDAVMFNTSYKAFENGLGSYKYRDDWNMLDQIIISNGLKDRYIKDSFEVIKPEFAVQKEGKYKGTSFPTFGGSKYLGGFSDHYPVSIKLIIN